MHTFIDQQLKPSLRAIRSRRDFSVLNEVAAGAMGRRRAPDSDSDHLYSAMTWLCRAQDAGEDGGASAYYDLATGTWAPSYPETTGYIMPTFFDFAELSGDRQYRERALRMAEWLLSLQLPDGGFPMGPLWTDLERQPIVFDTGQIVHGLVRVFAETGDDRALSAAIRACRWLADVLDSDGSWRRFTFRNEVHVYNARVAWAMVRAGQIGDDEWLIESAVRNLDWVLLQQNEDGWFRHASFEPNQDPVTHTIAYTIRGLLESGVLLQDDRYVSAARHAADRLLECLWNDGSLRGTYGPAWQPGGRWSCLAGDAQMAIIGARLYQLTGAKRYREAAHKLNAFLKSVHRREAWNCNIAGGLAGSFPVYADYHPYLYVNWAAKFFVDSLLLASVIR